MNSSNTLVPQNQRGGISRMFNLFNFVKRRNLKKEDVKEIKEKKETNKDAAKERLHLVLMQDRANVSADFLDLMKQEIIDVIKKYIDINEEELDVKLTNKINTDGTTGAPALYANIPIKSIKNSTRKMSKANTKTTKKVENKENKNDNNNKKADNSKVSEAPKKESKAVDTKKAEQNTKKPEQKNNEKEQVKKNNETKKNQSENKSQKEDSKKSSIKKDEVKKSNNSKK